MSKTYLELAEVVKLEDAAHYLRDRLLIRLLFRPGCRVSEVLDIAVDDIDFGQATVRVQHLKLRLNLSCSGCGGRLTRTANFCPGCGAKVDGVLSQKKEYRRIRTLPLDADTLEMIKDYVARDGPVSRNGRQLLFGVKRRQAWKIVRDCADRAGLGDLVNPETGKRRGVSPHRLRDAFATMAVQKDDSTDGIRMLQEHLGHANIGTTMRYRKIAGKELKEWYDKLWSEKDTR